MNVIRAAFQYLNPISRLGITKYSLLFPLVVNLLIIVLSEVYVYHVARNPLAVGGYIIFIDAFSILYFAFRDGMRGGGIAAGVSILYYFYIIYSRGFQGQQYVSAVETTISLGIIYGLVAAVIGYLRQKIDTLIEREANEKRRLQAIVQQLPVGIIITNEVGEVVMTNKNLEETIGFKLPNGLQAGKDLVLHGIHESKPMSADQYPISQAFASGKTITDFEFSIQRPDGKVVHLSSSASLIHNRAGKIIAAASITKDISERKELEIRKDDFVNMASHELKTPLTSMKLFIELASKNVKKYEDERVDTMLVNIKNQANRLQQLVSALLDVSRLQTGKLVFQKEYVRLDTCIEETLKGLSGATKDKTVEFIAKSDVSVYADRFRIDQVLTNLIMNAVKYSPENGRILIRLNVEGDDAVVSVEDFGIGIDKSQQKKIFDRLYQVTDTTEKTFPGLGMGLFIAKEIIRRHRGKIWVESQKGQGSRFYFTLPLHKQKNGNKTPAG